MFSALPLSAQTTWSGLKFGISSTEAEQALKDRGMTLSERVPYHFTVHPSYQVELPEVEKPVPFNVELDLSGGGKLKRIELQLDNQALLSRMGGNYVAMATLVNDRMKAALSAKYGAPVAVKGACESLSDAMLIHGSNVDCEESWKTEGQLITVSWGYVQGQGRVLMYYYFLEYLRASPDL